MSARRTLRRAAGGAALLLAIALVAELALRLAYLGASPALLGPWRRPAPWRQIRTLDASGAPWPRPRGEARWALHPWAAPVDYRLDERGLRVGADAEAVAPRDGCRVLVAGDSNAFGYGVAAADAYPTRLAAELARRDITARVDNAGVCGSNVRVQRAWLERLLPGSGADVVVLTVSPWSLRVDHAPPPRDATFADKLWNAIALRAGAASSVSSIADRGHRLLAHALHGVLGWPPDQAVAWELEPLLEPRADFSRRLEEAKAEIGGIARLARESGAALVLVFVPLDVQVSRARNRLYLEERLPYQALGFDDRDYTVDDRYRGVADLAGAVSAPLVDVTADLRAIARDAYLADDYHLSPAGNARVAAAVAPAVAHACGEAVQRGRSGELVARRGSE
ncbi:MAG: hypothetical protein AB1689_08185 [Thermodesulfobacteriota bacterium]